MLLDRNGLETMGSCRIYSHSIQSTWSGSKPYWKSQEATLPLRCIMIFSVRLDPDRAAAELLLESHRFDRP
jgi:hypothetical protein